MQSKRDEQEVLNDFLDYARMLRTSARRPEIAKVAADWEKFFQGKLDELQESNEVPSNQKGKES